MQIELESNVMIREDLGIARKIEEEEEDWIKWFFSGFGFYN
jgi:hypothetical protein